MRGFVAQQLLRCGSNVMNRKPAMSNLKLDVCIWTKNSANTLPHTLKRFEQVVPADVIGNKIMVDDHSTDETVEIGERFGWESYSNPGSGVASGANEALRHVQTPFFMSIEHDLLLSKDWWPTVFNHMSDERVAVSQGARLLTDPTLRAIYDNRDDHSIDNNIYWTEVIRQLGGFPSNCPVCTDTWLKRNVESAGYKWIIDREVVSDHVRYGIVQNAVHTYKLHSMCTCGRWRANRMNTKYLVRLALTSPATGLKIAVRYNVPKAVIAYPYIRLRILQAWLDGHLT